MEGWIGVLVGEIISKHEHNVFGWGSSIGNTLDLIDKCSSFEFSVIVIQSRIVLDWAIIWVCSFVES